MLTLGIAQATKIDWKEDSKNLTKLHPQILDEDDDLPAEPGSFFNYFEIAKDPYDVSAMRDTRAAHADIS